MAIPFGRGRLGRERASSLQIFEAAVTMRERVLVAVLAGIIDSDVVHDVSTQRIDLGRTVDHFGEEPSAFALNCL